VTENNDILGSGQQGLNGFDIDFHKEGGVSQKTRKVPKNSLSDQKAVLKLMAR
jgi:hypothetical protein